MLDYTFGGPAFVPASALTDRGFGDEIHGESGDDVVYGMRGNDIIYGDGQNDDLIGGYGDDWISGGTGDDAILGDDGRISTSRNSSTGWTLAGSPCTGNGTTCYSEPLYGVLALFPADPDTRTTQGNVLNEVTYTPGHIQEATMHVAGVLNKSVNLTPFNVDPNGIDPLFRPNGGYDDIIFGGLGNDAIHGGSGDDAMTGSEALVSGFAPNYITSCPNTGVPANCTAVRNGLIRIDFGHPTNPGDVLRHNPDDIDGWHYDRTRRAGEFDLYDEYEPRRAILFNAAAETWGCTAYSPSGKTCTASSALTAFPYHWFLNNTHNEGPSVNGCVSFAPNGTCLGTGLARTDGDDILFGDLGNDWIVGGTGRDTLWGGWGNDLLQADDHLEAGCLASTPNGTCTQTGSTWLNDGPDTHPMYEDRAVGGAGRDVLIGNTGGDRLIDWIGEFNSYIVPFAPFGIATVSRQVPPALFEFLYALSAAQGADPTRAADEGSADPERNGEPYGEIGLITQRDHGLWQDQSGAPADPQAGNIPGGKKDVLRSATFSDGVLSEAAIDSGIWDASGGALNVSAASLGGDAAAVLYVDQTLPVYYEIGAAVRITKPTGGWKANAYVIFDYFSPTDFKFAGLDQSTNKVVMGQRTTSGWNVSVQAAVGNVQFNRYYAMQVNVDGLVASVYVDGALKLTHQFGVRWIDDEPYGLNQGLVGVGSDNSRGTFDNIAVQSWAPQTTYDHREDFADGIADDFQPPASGQWAVTGGRLTGTPTNGGHAVALIAVPARSVGGTTLTVEATLRLAAGGSGGFVFDHYSARDYKFLSLDQATGTVRIAHVVKGSRVVDEIFTATVAADADLRILVTLNGPAVNISLNGLALGGYSFYGAVADGAVGTLGVVGTTSFDDVRVTTGVNVSSSPDRVAPTVTLPPNITRTTTGGASVYLNDITLGVATATDNVPGVVVSRTGVPIGNLFAIGTTTITWTATDIFGNQTNRFQLVTVTNSVANPLPTVSIADVSVTEGSKGKAKTVTLAVTLSASSTQTVNVTVGITGGSATSGTDYTGGSTVTLSFAPGTTWKSFRSMCCPT